MYTFETLNNGMRMLVAPSSGTDAATVLVLVKVGSRYETRELNGASHFIEHMMFKGTKKFPKSRDLSRTLEQYGADYNAYTGRDRTGYYVKIAGSHLDTGIELVHDMLTNSLYAPTEMKKERGVIIEEIHMYEDNPRMHVADLMEEAMFGDTPLGWNIAGTKAGMMSMTRSDVMRYRDSYYQPERMVIVLAGAVSDAHIAQAKKLFGSYRAAATFGGDFLPAPSFVPHAKPIVRMQKKETGQVQLALAFPGLAMNADQVPALRLLSTIMGEGMSSRLFEAVREKRGLAYSIGSSTGSLEDTGFFTIGAGLAKKEYAQAVETIVSEVEKMKKSGPTAKELAEAKTHLEGRMLLGLEDSSERAEWFARELLFGTGTIRTPAERMKDYARVTCEEIRRAARETFDLSRLSVGVIGPFGSESEVLKPLK